MALALTACQSNTVEPDVAVHDNVMHFNLVGPDAQTKVSAGAFEEADQIGLYVTDYVNETTPMPLQISGNRANNSLVTFDGSAWTPEQTIYWGTGKSDVYAYYPYFETVADVNNQYFEIATDQTGAGYEASDFLWAKAEGVRQTDGAVNLEMKHQMSKLTVKIIAGEDYIGSLPEDATVHLHSTVTNVNIDLEKGSVVKDPYSGAKSIKMRNLGIRTFDGVKAVVYEAIVVPQMLESSVPLIEINSKSVSYLLEDPFNFRPGVAYTYTATLNTSTTAIKVEIGCEIEDWNNAGGDSGNEGEGGSGEGGSEGDDDTKVYTNLSAAGTANCYLVQQAGDYKFKSVIGNTDATIGNVKTVEVLWESFGSDEMPNVGDLIASAYVILTDKAQGCDIMFCNVHLSGGNTAKKQLKVVAKYLEAELSQYITFLTGDFNANPISGAYAYFANVMEDSYVTCRDNRALINFTAHDYGKLTNAYRIDYCWHKGDVICVSYNTVTLMYNGYVSDHYGVFVVFERKAA